MEMDKRIVQMVDEGAANRIKELEAEVVSLKAAGRDYVELTLNQIKELEAELAKWEEREGAVCPEDVGFDEYIRTLVKANEGLYSSAVKLEAANTHLRACLKQIKDATVEHIILVIAQEGLK